MCFFHLNFFLNYIDFNVIHVIIILYYFLDHTVLGNACRIALNGVLIFPITDKVS